jgi:hypothetical protein
VVPRHLEATVVAPPKYGSATTERNVNGALFV